MRNLNAATTRSSVVSFFFVSVAYFNQSFLLLFPEEGYVKMYLKGRPITMFMPKEQVDGYCLEAKGELPSNKLKLDWVYPFYAAAWLVTVGNEYEELWCD